MITTQIVLILRFCELVNSKQRRNLKTFRRLSSCWKYCSFQFNVPKPHFWSRGRVVEISYARIWDVRWYNAFTLQCRKLAVHGCICLYWTKTLLGFQCAPTNFKRWNKIPVVRTESPMKHDKRIAPCRLVMRPQASSRESRKNHETPRTYKNSAIRFFFPHVNCMTKW